MAIRTSGGTKATDKADAVGRKVAPQLMYLYDRWQDEGAYEDFAVYEAAAKKALLAQDPSAVFLRLSKRPFELRAKIGGAEVGLFVTATRAGIRYY